MRDHELETGATDPAAGEEFETNLDAMGDDDLDNLGDDARVPVGVIRKIRQQEKAKRRSMEEQLAAKDDQLLIYRTRVAQIDATAGGDGRNGATSSQQGRSRDILADKDPDDVLTVAEFRQVAAQFGEAMNFMRLQSKSDFQEVVENYLPEVLKDNPHIAAVLRNIPNETARWQTAYEFAKMSPQYRNKKLDGGVKDQTQRAKENMMKPMSPGKLGGAASASSSEAIKNMSSEEFRVYRDKVRRGG